MSAKNILPGPLAFISSHVGHHDEDERGFFFLFPREGGKGAQNIPSGETGDQSGAVFRFTSPKEIILKQALLPSQSKGTKKSFHGRKSLKVA